VVIELASNRYGKAAIRLVRVARDPAGDRIRDLTVAVALGGAFEAAHTDGDNSMVIATDTMKNTAYAFAKDHLGGSIEAYGRALAEHFLAEPQVATATVNVRSHDWRAIDVAGSPARDAFVRGGEGTRLATVTAGRIKPRSCSCHQRQASISAMSGFEWIRLLPRSTNLKCLTALVT